LITNEGRPRRIAPTGLHQNGLDGLRAKAHSREHSLKAGLGTKVVKDRIYVHKRQQEIFVLIRFLETLILFDDSN